MAKQQIMLREKRKKANIDAAFYSSDNMFSSQKVVPLHALNTKQHSNAWVITLEKNLFKPFLTGAGTLHQQKHLIEIRTLKIRNEWTQAFEAAEMKQLPVLIYSDAPYPARPLKWPNGSKNILLKLLPQDRTLQPETAATEARSKCLKKQRDALVPFLKS